MLLLLRQACGALIVLHHGVDDGLRIDEAAVQILASVEQILKWPASLLLADVDHRAKPLLNYWWLDHRVERISALLLFGVVHRVAADAVVQFRPGLRAGIGVSFSVIYQVRGVLRASR